MVIVFDHDMVNAGCGSLGRCQSHGFLDVSGNGFSGPVRHVLTPDSNTCTNPRTLHTLPPYVYRGRESAHLWAAFVQTLCIGLCIPIHDLTIPSLTLRLAYLPISPRAKRPSDISLLTAAANSLVVCAWFSFLATSCFGR